MVSNILFRDFILTYSLQLFSVIPAFFHHKQKLFHYCSLHNLQCIPYFIAKIVWMLNSFVFKLVVGLIRSHTLNFYGYGLVWFGLTLRFVFTTRGLIRPLGIWLLTRSMLISRNGEYIRMYFLFSFFKNQTNSLWSAFIKEA